MQGFCILVFFIKQHLSAPEDVVGNNKPAVADLIEDEIVIIGIIRLIGVDKNEIECLGQSRYYVYGIPEMEFNFVLVFGFCDKGSRHLVSILLYIQCDDLSVLSQAFGKTKSRI